MNTMPYVIEQTGNGERSYDIFSRLLKDRIIMLNDEVNKDSAALVIAQLLFLESQDSEKDICLYINSPGGVVTDGLAILDTMRHLKCDVQTVCMGMAASMGAVLLVAGEQGMRAALPHSRVMIHQPLGGIQGQASDIEITAKEILKLKDELYQIISDKSGKSMEQIRQDADRDHWMTAAEALEYGMIDKVYTHKN
jgi:ATP-dependent Clp protease protease subunit